MNANERNDRRKSGRDRKLGTVTLMKIVPQVGFKLIQRSKFPVAVMHRMDLRNTLQGV